MRARTDPLWFRRRDAPVGWDLATGIRVASMASGLGRFGGEWALEEFTTDHWVSVQEQPHPYPL